MKSSGVWRKVCDLGSDFYTDLFWLLVYMLAGGLAPLWGAWSYKAMHTASIPVFAEFTRAGEFSLYTASFVASAGYLLAHDRKKLPFPGRLGLFLICGLLLGGAVFCYMIVAPQVLSGEHDLLRSPELFSNTTIALFVAAVTFYVIVFILDATRLLTDIRTIDDAQVQRLVGRVDELPK